MGILRNLADKFDPAEIRTCDYGTPASLGNSFVPLVPVNPNIAENLSTIFACITAISTSIASLPALVYQNSAKGRTEANTHALARLIKNGPNDWQTWPDFAEFFMAQVLLRGNALAEIVTDRSGNVLELRPIPWPWVSVQMLRNGKLVYDVTEQIGVYGAQGNRRRLLSSEVLHLRDRSDDGLIGRSRLQRSAATVSTAQSIFNHTSSIYNNGLYPSAVVTSQANLSAEAMAGVRQNFESMLMGAHKAAKLLILPGGNFDWKTLSISPEDAELLGSRKHTTEELCRLYQVPPPLVQDYSHNTFTNSEQAGRWYAQFCLLPWVKKFEAVFNRALFFGTGYELSLDMSAFDRGDPATRWQAHAIAAQNQILTVDEIREVEGWNPKPVTSGDMKGDMSDA